MVVDRRFAQGRRAPGTHTRPRCPPEGLAAMGERTANGSGVAGIAPKHHPWPALRLGLVATPHGQKAGARIVNAYPWATEEGRDKVECPLMIPPL